MFCGKDEKRRKQKRMDSRATCGTMRIPAEATVLDDTR
jgi:hypothetical protein